MNDFDKFIYKYSNTSRGWELGFILNRKGAYHSIKKVGMNKENFVRGLQPIIYFLRRELSMTEQTTVGLWTTIE